MISNNDIKDEKLLKVTQEVLTVLSSEEEQKFLNESFPNDSFVGICHNDIHYGNVLFD